jgi:hypothetical protein
MPTVPDPLRRQERLNTLEDILLAVLVWVGGRMVFYDDIIV